jgi:hypothetical protein
MQFCVGKRERQRVFSILETKSSQKNMDWEMPEGMDEGGEAVRWI